MPGTSQDETRTLAFLRHLAVEEVEGHRFRSDIHHRRQSLLVHRYVVLLFRIEGGCSVSFGQRQRRTCPTRTGKMQTGKTLRPDQTAREVRRNKPESTHEQNDQKKSTQSHSFQSLSKTQ